MASPKDDGAELWREVIRTVRPLARVAPNVPQRLHVAAVAPTVRIVTAPRPAPATRAHAHAHALLADRSPEKRVRRGRVAVGGRLDLHGFTQEDARVALARFLAHHRAEGARCVLVVTGKGGRGGMGEGVLKQNLPGWLAGLREHASGYAEAHQKHGGGGAFYVFLRAR